MSAAAILAAVRKADPTAELCAPPSSWLGGCTDPGCCAQHPGTGMVGLGSALSGTHLHKIIVEVHQRADSEEYCARLAFKAILEAKETLASRISETSPNFIGASEGQLLCARLHRGLERALLKATQIQADARRARGVDLPAPVSAGDQEALEVLECSDSDSD